MIKKIIIFCLRYSHPWSPLTENISKIHRKTLENAWVPFQRWMMRSNLGVIHAIAPVTLHSRYSQILVHSHSSLHSWSALALVSPELSSFPWCKQRGRQSEPATHPHSALQNRNWTVVNVHTGSHAPLSLQSRPEISFDSIATWAWMEREWSVTASVNACSEMH